MAGRRIKVSGARTRSKLMKTVADHPVATVAITSGAVLGAVLVTKAAKTVARVATINAAGKAAKDVARAVRAKPKPKAKRPRK